MSSLEDSSLYISVDELDYQSCIDVIEHTEAIDEAKAKQKSSEITEDELKIAETEIQKITDKNIEEIDKLLANKETEIMSV